MAGLPKLFPFWPRGPLYVVNHELDKKVFPAVKLNKFKLSFYSTVI